MKYELEIFDRIIGGDLSPFADGICERTKYNDAIKQKYNLCYNYIIATFKTSKQKVELIDKKVISNLHPFAQNEITPQQNLFQVADIENIAPNAFKGLKLKRDKIVHVSYSRQPHKTIVYFKEIRECGDIPCNEAKYYYYNDLLREATETIKSNIKQNVFKSESAYTIEEYIYKNQSALFSLSYRLMKLISPKNKKDIYNTTVEFTDIDILCLTFIYLEELLRFIEKNYFKYIDVNIQVPYRSALIKAYDITDKLETVKPALLTSNINKELLKIIFVPFLKLSAFGIEEKITYQQLSYLNIYISSFYDYVVTHSPESITDDAILQLVKELNYNPVEMFAFIIDRFILKVEPHESLTDKIDSYYQCLKTVNQINCKTPLSYNSNLPSLKHQIIGWLEEEINYLTKKLQLQAQKQPNLFSQQEKVKLQSGLSVAQLAYFFKLQADTGIITHKNQRDIFRHIAENYQTSKVHEISAESVGSKFYNVENSTIEAIKTMIINVLNEVNKNRI